MIGYIFLGIVIVVGVVIVIGVWNDYRDMKNYLENKDDNF